MAAAATTQALTAGADPARVARLQYLAGMLSKYRAAYYRAADSGGLMSARMMRWVDEYNAARHTPEWYEFCRLAGYDPGHQATDTFA